MGFRIRGSHIIAVLLAGGLAAWMASGRLSADGAAAEDAALPPIAERQAEQIVEDRGNDCAREQDPDTRPELGAVDASVQAQK